MNISQQDNSELYIYLGKQLDAYFFIHTIHDSNFNNEISYQIYNVMINEQMILNLNEIVIIYEFDPYNNICNVIRIQHLLNPYHIQIYKNNLEKNFLNLITAKRDDIFIIKYDYINKCYLSYEINNTDCLTNIFNKFNEVNEDKLIINDIYEIETLKPLTN